MRKDAHIGTRGGLVKDARGNFHIVDIPKISSVDSIDPDSKQRALEAYFTNKGLMMASQAETARANLQQINERRRHPRRTREYSESLRLPRR